MNSLGPQNTAAPSPTPLPQRLHALALASATWLTQHRRRVSATALTLLAGYGITAFGIAPLAPDAALLPQRVVSESVTPSEALDAQLEALAGLRLPLRRTELSRASDSLDSLLRRLGVSDPAALAWLRLDPLARRMVEGRPGKLVQAEVDSSGHLQHLVVRGPLADDASRFERLTVQRSADGHWQAQRELGTLQASTQLASGTIRSTLFAATDDAGLPDKVASQLAELFAADIDFHRELRKGDSFSLVFETLTADGEPVPWAQGAGRVLAAEFINKGRSYQALWFGQADGKGAYYDFSGQSKRRAFLASPMEFTRVTSGFAMRFHPILQTWRAHLGTDYGAPTGTPVRSVGEGKVSFAGRQNGYGNVVFVQHAGDRTTVYAHLSRIDVKQGQRIEQGQRIGAVGATGWATGPHLHFEVRVNGQQQDPQKLAKASESIPLSAALKPQFQQVAQRLKAQLDVADELQGLPGRVE